MADKLKSEVSRQPVDPPLRLSGAILPLAIAIGLLALVATVVGLFWQTGGGSFTFTTLRGGTAEIFGQGLYRYDSVFTGAGNRGTDTVTLFLGVPFLALATMLYRRGSLRGGLLLTGILGYFLYVYATYSLGVAYNELFLVYVALFSASLFAFILAFNSIDLDALSSQVLDHLPRRGPGIFLIVAGLLTSLIWIEGPVTSLLTGLPPARMNSYTTLVTYALDLAIIVPSCIIGGVMILRRNALGYRIAFPLLVLIIMLVPGIIAQTIHQLSAGVSLSPGEIAGPVSGFLTLGLLAVLIIVAVLRKLPITSPSE